MGKEDELSWTAFQSCVEFSFDIDIIPFAVPFRIKSAFSHIGLSVFLHQACFCRRDVHLFHTIHICIMDIKERPIPQLQVPGQVRLIQIIKQAHRQVF